jgi:GTPase
MSDPTDRPGARTAVSPAAERPPARLEPHRSGFACFVGRPNAGKSTLTNALVGGKVAITSSRPQTTRHAIRGILNRPDAQLVIVDTPGLHKPRTLLGSRLNDIVRQTWAEVDVIGFCVPADAPVGRGDEFIAGELRSVATRTPVIGIVTKTDLAAPLVIAERLTQLAELTDRFGIEAEIVPCSAVDGFQLDTLTDLLVARLPEGPKLYPGGELTDEPETTLVAELIREAALEGVRDELPHSIAVLVEEMLPHEGRDDLLDVHAVIYVERQSQKGIIIGKGGARLKEVGTAARRQIEALLGTRIYLDLHVSVAKDWQRDPRQLRKLGF